MKSILASLLCLMAIIAATGRAAETDQIKQLTVEQAKRLAQDKSGRLMLDGLTMLSPEAAQELAQYEGWLYLNGLATLSQETADALGQHKGPLHLDGLKSISDDIARSLARHDGELSLRGLTSISNEAAKALAQHRGGRLYLNGLTTISPAAASAFSQRKGNGVSVSLEGLTTLSPETAAAMASLNRQQWDGRLPNVKTISDEAARELAKRSDGELSMEGLTVLSDEAAKVLAPKLNGRQPALTSVSPVSAKALGAMVPGQWTRPLVLDSLTTLSDDAAIALSRKDQRGLLSLNGLKTLSPAAARAICVSEGDLHLNGLTTLSDETLAALAEHQTNSDIARPVVNLKGLNTFSDEGAAILAAWPKWCGQLPALTTLSPKTAKALAGSRNWDGQLPAVTTITADAARALVARQGDLSLDGLTKIDDEVASALTKHQGGTLSLDGMKNVSDSAAAALAEHNGRLSLGGLTTLSSDAAEALARYKGDWLLLDGLTTLSDDAAKALAQRQEVLSVIGLQSLSDEAAQVLAANPRIIMPEAGPLSRTSLADQEKRPAIDLAADAEFVRSFLGSHCADCHGNGADEGGFTLQKLTRDDIAGRVAYASIFERLRAGDMPPPSEPRPKADDVAKVVDWIEAKLDTPLAGPPAYYAVEEKPVDGNRLPNAIVFGGPRGPSVPPPPRLWRLSPGGYERWVGEFGQHGLQQPFGVIQEPGFKDFAALYAPDEGASNLLLSNAAQIVEAQTRNHRLVQVDDKDIHQPWPNEARAESATAQEREQLKAGVRVNHGHGIFAPLMHPQVRANREELERAIRQQYMTAISRPPGEKELQSLFTLYDELVRDGDARIAGTTILMAPLMVPEAILRFEIGLGPEVRSGVRMLSPREAAFAVSYALSARREKSLFDAAENGALVTREDVAAHVQKILEDQRAPKSRVLGFFREYFNYHYAPEVFKDPLPGHLSRRGVHYNARRYVIDTDMLVLDVLSRDQDVLGELLTTTVRFRSLEHHPVGEALGDHNGRSIFRALAPEYRDQRVETSEDEELIGILMQPSCQVAWSTNFHNDIVRRGRWVREHLLGGRVPDLPINVAAMIPDDPHKTLRQRQMVTRTAECWKCHQKMDELGLPFENLNHYGFARSAEEVLDLEAMEQNENKNSKIYRYAPLDTTGFVRNSGDPMLDGPVRDAPEMLRRLAESDRVRQIFIRHVFRYFLGRNETPGDAVSLQEAEQAYLDNNGSFKALLISLLSSESFLYRTLPQERKE